MNHAGWLDFHKPQECRYNDNDMDKKYSLLDIRVHYKDTCG